MKRGKVALVGAGPGDVGLLTLKGKTVLEQCDVVLYDRLISHEILGLIPKNVEKISVGKQAGNHSVPQKKINELLLELSLQGKNVVRLKGGDSFLFGRGAEELELLQEHHIEFSVIPGISSPLAVGTYGGIPVTHRDFSSSVHIFTGHKKEDENLDFDYPTMANLQGTLIFLMSVSSFPEIISNLMRVGLSCETPVTVIENGTKNNQRRFTTTANFISDIILQENIISPAIFYVGKVASLEFNWFSKRNLFGKKILVPYESCDGLSFLLREEGAEIISFSSLETKVVSKKIPDLSPYTTIIFTSKRGVESFFTLLREEKLDARCFYGKKVAVVGESTGETLMKYGIIPDFTPSIYRGEVLAQELIAQSSQEDAYLIVEGFPNSSEVESVFNAKCVNFKVFTSYEISYEKQDVPEGNYDLVVFTSRKSVENFLEFFPNRKNLPCVCIGETTENTAKNHGFTTIRSKKSTFESLVDCVKEFFYDTST